MHHQAALQLEVSGNVHAARSRAGVRGQKRTRKTGNAARTTRRVKMLRRICSSFMLQQCGIRLGAENALDGSLHRRLLTYRALAEAVLSERVAGWRNRNYLAGKTGRGPAFSTVRDEPTSHT